MSHLFIPRLPKVWKSSHNPLDGCQEKTNSKKNASVLATQGLQLSTRSDAVDWALCSTRSAAPRPQIYVQRDARPFSAGSHPWCGSHVEGRSRQNIGINSLNPRTGLGRVNNLLLAQGQKGSAFLNQICPTHSLDCDHFDGFGRHRDGAGSVKPRRKLAGFSSACCQMWPKIRLFCVHFPETLADIRERLEKSSILDI